MSLYLIVFELIKFKLNLTKSLSAVIFQFIYVAITCVIRSILTRLNISYEYIEIVNAKLPMYAYKKNPSALRVRFNNKLR